jgi:GTPase involved in cell partitioning and DNA repair
MEKFRPEMAGRPAILAFSKMDLPGARDSAEMAFGLLNFPGSGAYYISAVTGEGITALLDGLLAFRMKRAPDAP